VPRSHEQDPLPPPAAVNDPEPAATGDPHPPENPPPCCAKQTITIPPPVAAKTRQKHDYPSPEHRRSYTRRTAAERTFSTIKDPAASDISRGWCRLMGLTPLTLWLDCVLIVRNQRHPRRIYQPPRRQRPPRRDRAPAQNPPAAPQNPRQPRRRPALTARSAPRKQHQRHLSRPARPRSRPPRPRKPPRPRHVQDQPRPVRLTHSWRPKISELNVNMDTGET